jgi:hypothetical protein
MTNDKNFVHENSNVVEGVLSANGVLGLANHAFPTPPTHDNSQNAWHACRTASHQALNAQDTRRIGAVGQVYSVGGLLKWLRAI